MGGAKMLDFLVLGIVPGTKITLTITWVLIIGLVVSLSCLAYIERKKLKQFKQEQSDRLKLSAKVVRQS